MSFVNITYMYKTKHATEKYKRERKITRQSSLSENCFFFLLLFIDWIGIRMSKEWKLCELWMIQWEERENRNWIEPNKTKKKRFVHFSKRKEQRKKTKSNNSNAKTHRNRFSEKSFMTNLWTIVDYCFRHTYITKIYVVFTLSDWKSIVQKATSASEPKATTTTTKLIIKLQCMCLSFVRLCLCYYSYLPLVVCLIFISISKEKWNMFQLRNANGPFKWTLKNIISINV